MPAGKVIIATYGFPPYIESLGGSIRILKLAEYLLEQGMDVVVVCAATPHHDAFGYESTLRKIRTVACNDPIAALAQRIKGPASAASPSAAQIQHSLLTRLKKKLKPLVLDAMVPDTGFMVARSMARAIEKEMATANGPVTVITSGPPHSIHLVGKRIKRAYRQIKWILDYRDSWNGTSLFRKKNSLLQKINERMERECLNKADHLAYISAPMLPKAEEIARSTLQNKATLIANGYDERLQLTAVPQPSPSCAVLRIGYFGALDQGHGSYRDPGVLYAALDTLPDGTIQFVVHGPSALDQTWASLLGDKLHNGGKLAHADAIEKMTQMDALLLLHTRDEGADEVVTGKVFEYISTGLPIISVGPRGMAVNQLLRGDPAFHWVSHTDREGITSLFRSLIENKRNGQSQRRDETIIRSFSRTAQHEKFIELICSHP